jgi:hypothetical protein
MLRKCAIALCATIPSFTRAALPDDQVWLMSYSEDDDFYQLFGPMTREEAIEKAYSTDELKRVGCAEYDNTEDEGDRTPGGGIFQERHLFEQEIDPDQRRKSGSKSMLVADLMRHEDCLTWKQDASGSFGAHQTQHPINSQIRQGWDVSNKDLRDAVLATLKISHNAVLGEQVTISSGDQTIQPFWLLAGKNYATGEDVDPSHECCIPTNPDKDHGHWQNIDMFLNHDAMATLRAEHRMYPLEDHDDIFEISHIRKDGLLPRVILVIED